MKRFFHGDLENLRSKLALMSDSACETVEVAIDALLNNDIDKADAAIKADDRIDALEVEIDTEAIRYIALRAPQAGDLRILTVAMKACHDLERVGDEATGIAKRTKKFDPANPPKEFYNIAQMAKLSVQLLRDAMKSFISEGLEGANKIPLRDNEIDTLNAENFDSLTKQLAANPAEAHACVELMFVSRSLERVGDHAVNIAEEVIYMLSGQDVRHTGMRGKNAS